MVSNSLDQPGEGIIQKILQFSGISINLGMVELEGRCVVKNHRMSEKMSIRGVSKHERIRGMPNEQEKDHRTTQD